MPRPLKFDCRSGVKKFTDLPLQINKRRGIRWFKYEHFRPYIYRENDEKHVLTAPNRLKIWIKRKVRGEAAKNKAVGDADTFSRRAAKLMTNHRRSIISLSM